jgi:hypothetical protein
LSPSRSVVAAVSIPVVIPVAVAILVSIPAAFERKIGATAVIDPDASIV